MKTIESIYAELDMYPKFGLVSRVDSGCHNDMDYETFVQSTLSIKPHLREYIQYGLRKEHNPKMLQEIGKRAEAAMFETTGNVNTQKGLIFALGLFLPVITKAIIDNKTKDDVISEIKILAQEIIGTYFDSINEDTAKTYGDNIYLKYGYKGIRGEALNGFEKVFKNNRYYEDENDRFVQYLIGLMSELKDTTILHRKDITTLEKVNNEMKSIIKNGGYLNNKELVHSLSNEYKELGISPGGSADLLVLKIIFEDLRYLLCGNEKNGICL